MVPVSTYRYQSRQRARAMLCFSWWSVAECILGGFITLFPENPALLVQRQVEIRIFVLRLASFSLHPCVSDSVSSAESLGVLQGSLRSAG